MKRKLPEKFFEQNQRAKTRKWKFFNLNQALWGAGNREFRLKINALTNFDPDSRKSPNSFCPARTFGSAQPRSLTLLPYDLSLEVAFQDASLGACPANPC